MNQVIQERALDRAKAMIRGNTSSEFDRIVSDLDEFLLSIKRYRDQHESLIFIRNYIAEELSKHKETCQFKGTSGDCPFEKKRNRELFALEQAIEDVVRFIEEPVSEDGPMSGGEQSEMYNVLNDILQKIDSLQLQHSEGIEFLYGEINDLKERMNYDKKTFRQLAFGKVAEAVALGIIDKSVGSQIYSAITHVFSNTSNLLDKL